ncbi:hypothetical protein BDW62DRAFT_202956 [Aspergillus aurantiobrunneus]
MGRALGSRAAKGWTTAIEFQCSHGLRDGPQPIGPNANQLARLGNKISIADPIAFYDRECEESVFQLDQHGADSDTQDLVPLTANPIKYERGGASCVYKVIGSRVVIALALHPTPFTSKVAVSAVAPFFIIDSLGALGAGYGSFQDIAQ